MEYLSFKQFLIDDVWYWSNITNKWENLIFSNPNLKPKFDLND